MFVCRVLRILGRSEGLMKTDAMGDSTCSRGCGGLVRGTTRPPHRIGDPIMQTEPEQCLCDGGNVPDNICDQNHVCVRSPLRRGHPVLVATFRCTERRGASSATIPYHIIIIIISQR